MSWLGPVCVAQSLTVGGWSAGYRVACTVSASYGQGLDEAGHVRGAARGRARPPVTLVTGGRWPVGFELRWDGRGRGAPEYGAHTR